MFQSEKKELQSGGYLDKSNDYILGILNFLKRKYFLTLPGHQF